LYQKINQGESILNTKRVGQILRESREEKKLSVKDVAKETNIAAKYIIALETEDYSQFPAETFALGFLKNYASYLKLDSAMLLNLYRGEQIEESQAPLEELTRPTSSPLSLDKNKLISVISIALLFVSIYIIYLSFEDSGSSSDDVSTEVTPNVNVNSSEIPQGINFVSQSVPENASIPFILTEDRGVSFSVNNQQCKIFIKGVSQGKANLGFNIFPEKNVYFFQTGEGEETILSYRIEELSSLRRDIRIVTQAVTEKSAKILVTLKEEREGVAVKSPVGDVPIQVTLFFSKPSYVEFVIDGQMGERGLVSAGEVKHLEARDRLEIKVGDGGAVEMVQNGKERVVLGKPGKLVKKIFIRKANPYDSTQSIIGELGE
jgi:transcriptional regulator with XRE-family HTH domain